MAEKKKSTTPAIQERCTADWELRERVMKTFMMLTPNDKAYILGRMDGKIEAYARQVAS